MPTHPTSEAMYSQVSNIFVAMFSIDVRFNRTLSCSKIPAFLSKRKFYLLHYTIAVVIQNNFSPQTLQLNIMKPSSRSKLTLNFSSSLEISFDESSVFDFISSLYLACTSPNLVCSCSFCSCNWN